LDAFAYDASNKIPVNERPELDQWILSKLQSLIKETETAYENYDVTPASRAIMNFTVDQLSNWYVRLARKRFWRGDMNADKQAAYETLYECLEVISSLISPIAPFYADWLFQNLTASLESKPLSVHLTDWKLSDEGLINLSLENSMQLAQDISSLVHSLRKKERLKVRQPLQKVLIPVLNEDTKALIEHVEDLIKSEVNIKSIEYIDDTSDILVKSIKPNFALLGKRFGPKMKAVSQIIQQWGKEEIAQIEKEGQASIQLDGESVLLQLEEVLIQSQDIPGWSVATDNGITVALDVTLTTDLKEEGVARDFVNRIQNLRKDMGLEVQDKIRIQIAPLNETVDNALLNFSDYIKTETQALALTLDGDSNNSTVLDMDEFELAVKVEKV
jgi:isoleucyl-tRNA synthetase